jgi:glycosyltransferase A (GT-A) superfamily protein (DUF2064 family)
MQTWLGSIPLEPQSDGDLGDRLTSVVRNHFAKDSAGPIVLLGGDCPYLSCEMLRSVALALHNAHFVLIPAFDGGYCLLGLGKPFFPVFEGIAWSTESVMDQTRQILRSHGESWIELDTLEDVDDAASWDRALSAFPELASPSYAVARIVEKTFL